MIQEKNTLVKAYPRQIPDAKIWALALRERLRHGCRDLF